MARSSRSTRSSAPAAAAAGFDQRANGALFFRAGGAAGPFHSPLDSSECLILWDESTGELGVLAGDQPVGLARVPELPVTEGKPVKVVLNWLQGDQVSQHRLALFIADHPTHGKYVQVRLDRVSVGSKFDALRARVGA